MQGVHIRLLGGFGVTVDGRAVDWTYGRARELVKLLALAPGHRLPRDQVVEQLWPQLGADAGLANLHKAASHARQSLGHADAVVLREGIVALAPGVPVQTDVERFEGGGDYGGDLLPDDPYAPWATERRAELRARYLERLRAGERWEELAGAEPADEPAQQAIMRARLAGGDRAGALRAFERLRAALDEIGLQPSVETLALHGRIAGGAALDRALARVEDELAAAAPADRAELLATRADLLLAVGDRSAPAAYAEAAAAAGPEGMALRIRQAWAQLANGDPAAAQSTLAPLHPTSDAERAGRLIAQAAAAWFSGDVEGSRVAAAEAEPIALAAGLAEQARAAVAVQAMVAHSAGDWPRAVQHALEVSLTSATLSDTLFDGHLCIAEYALAAGQPHADLERMARDLHAQAVRTGARRAQVFAATVLGALALAAGRFDGAEQHLREAVGMSRRIGAVSAEALATARLAQALNGRGDAQAADALFTDAMVIACWAPLRDHVKPLVFAAALAAADDAQRAAERLDDAQTQLRGELPCAYCATAYTVAAAGAAVRAGRSEAADAYLAEAEARLPLWPGGDWPAAIAATRQALQA